MNILKKNGILNSEISKLLSDLGHTDQITICDCGLPIPQGVKKIDISLKKGDPTFIDVLKEVKNDMEIEKIILAEEIKTKNADVYNKILELFENIKIEYIPHKEFKEVTRSSKGIVRTGEVTAFSNIILQSGVLF